MRSASTWMPEKRTQTPSPSPDLFPAKTANTLTGNLHSDWYSKRGHFTFLFEFVQRRIILWIIVVLTGLVIH
jgi:hypothetical protein